MTGQKLFLFVFCLFLIILAVYLITIFGQGQPWYPYVYYFFLSVISVLGFIAILPKVEEFIDRHFKQKYAITHEKIAKIVLHRLFDVGNIGVKAEIFNSYLIGEYPELEDDERFQLCNDLETYGLVTRYDEYICISSEGKKYIGEK
jgi:hypothetical protein